MQINLDKFFNLIYLLLGHTTKYLQFNYFTSLKLWQSFVEILRKTAI
jgi:hypothetical protein